MNFFESTFQSFCLIPSWSGGKPIESNITDYIRKVLNRFTSTSGDKTISTIVASPPIKSTPSTLLSTPKNIQFYLSIFQETVIKMHKN